MGISIREPENAIARFLTLRWLAAIENGGTYLCDSLLIVRYAIVGDGGFRSVPGHGQEVRPGNLPDLFATVDPGASQFDLFTWGDVATGDTRLRLVIEVTRQSIFDGLPGVKIDQQGQFAMMITLLAVIVRHGPEFEQGGGLFRQVFRGLAIGMAGANVDEQQQCGGGDGVYSHVVFRWLLEAGGSLIRRWRTPAS